LNIEGLGRQLYPQLDLWDTAKPFLENWMKEQLGFSSFAKQVKHNAPLWIEQLPEFPGQVFDLVQQTRRGKLRINYQSDTLNRIENKIESQNKTTIQAILSAALLVSGAVLYSSNMVFEAQIVSGLGIIGAVWAFFK